jgi:hypothetical protein
MPAHPLCDHVWCHLVGSLVVEPVDDLGVDVRDRLQQRFEELRRDEPGLVCPPRSSTRAVIEE